jgi:hypothetical protein
MNIVPLPFWRQSPPWAMPYLVVREMGGPPGHTMFNRQKGGVPHKGTVTSDTACECLVTSELTLHVTESASHCTVASKSRLCFVFSC